MVMRWMMAAVLLLVASSSAFAMEGERSVEAALSLGTAPGTSRSETRFGGIIGAGLQYALPQNYFTFLRLDYHVIEDSYLTAGIGLGYSF
ncbi:hypothetical protein L4X63_11780 [Geomonas sp. Red32]|uniref:hypothetical protein n=1 Tax=Geomonas sp. Red32 TaxID=2912856 RepID=UPI00202D0BE1|nr:hypothetical protein [Geomonas sp. Red32]MCM0082269.1 hypothetical protein [Geomonas sp. Red32]